MWYWRSETGKSMLYVLEFCDPKIGSGLFHLSPRKPSDSCMMIPGTYAQMHEDYD